MKPLRNICINPGNAIVVIVDVQNEFCKPGGRAYYDISSQIMPGVISAIQGVVQRARDVGIPIIYIQSVRTLQEPEFTVFGVPPVLQIGTWASEIVEELKPHERDVIVQKYSHDPFYKKDLDQVLGRLVTDPTNYYAVVAGGAINVCLYHTTMGFHVRNYWTVVPVDCVYYLSDIGKERALGQFSEERAYPNVFLTSSDLIEVSPVPTTTRPRLI